MVYSLWSRGEARDQLVSSHIWIGKIRHCDSVRSVGQDQIVNQEWYFTSKVIAQIMFVFISSIYDVLKTQMVFHQRSNDAIMCTATCQQAHWTSFVNLAGEVLFEKKPPTSIKPEATPGKRTELRTSCQQDVPHTQDEKAETSLLTASLTRQVLDSPHRSTMVADLIKSEKRQITSTTIFCHTLTQRFMLNKTATWNDMKFQRSKVVFNAQYGPKMTDQTRHVVLVVACCEALPRRSRSRQSNESAVLECINYLKRIRKRVDVMDTLQNQKNSRKP